MLANDYTLSRRLKVALFILSGPLCVATSAKAGEKSSARPIIADQPVASTNRPMRSRKDMVLTVGQDRGDLQGTGDKIIQAGIEYLDRMGGGTLEILPGVYDMRNAVYLRSNITLRGSGGGTVLRKAASVVAPLVRDSDWFEYGVQVEDATRFAPGAGIMLRSSKGKGDWQFEVLRATVTAVDGDIIYLDRMTEKNFWTEQNATAGTIFPILTAAENVDDVVVENLVLDGNRDENEHINGNFAGGVFIQSCNRWRFNNVVSRNYNGDGFSFQVCDDIQFRNCKAMNNADLGFHPGSGSQRPVFRNCESRGNSQGIFFCWSVSDGIADNCILAGNSRYGISIGHRDTDNLLSKCIIERNGEVGILFRREASEFRCGNRNRIENCIIRDNGTKKPGIGIDILGKTEDITIRNTRLENTTGENQKIGIRISADAERVVLHNNTFENCPVRVKDLSIAGKLEQCPPVVFIKRPAQGRKGTNGTMLGQRTKIGSAICVYDPRHPERGAKTIFDAPEGFIFDMSLSYDAQKVLFSFMDKIGQEKDSFHVWEIDIDGTGLRQLTAGPYHDSSAVYLPDGKIVFCSTRVESFSLCQDFLAAAMYVMDADGSNLRRLEYNTLCDVTPYVMEDGSILFTRWEYQDKNIFCTQGLWTINPDGTRLQLFYGNTLVVPNSIYGARQIPGTRKLVCTMAPHHGRPLGAIGVIDRSRGIEDPKSIINITPEIPYQPRLAANWKIDEREWQPGDVQYHWAYTDPWPLAEDLFLVSYGGPVKGGPERYRLYLLNESGQKALLYDDPETSCYCPIPLVSRPLPHRLPGEVPAEAEGEGTFFLADIYQGLWDKGVKRGQIKALRIMSQVAKKYNTEGPRYHDHYPVVGYGTYYVKHYYGTVPVDENGAAYFKAPAGVELYFIAIDRDGKEIRRMGTVTQLTDGETQSCVGCHESRSSAPPGRSAAMARLRTEPDSIEPPAWGAGAVDFAEHVQPVFDRYCVECHSGRRPDGRVDLSGDKSRLFSMGYKSLIDRGLVEYYYLNTAPTGNFQPLQSGSWVSRLTELIESEHAGVKMDDESRQRIYVWIDSNVPYYSTWDMSRPYTMGGRDTWAEDKKAMASWYRDFETVFESNCTSCHNSIVRRMKKPKIDHTWINLTRPEFSRALNAHLSEQAGGFGLTKKKHNQSPPLFENRNDPVYLAMLKAIRQGKKALDAKPRVDMPGATAVAQQRDFGKLY